MLGNGNVGKTSLLDYYASKGKSEHVDHPGDDFCYLDYVSDCGDECRLKIWHAKGMQNSVDSTMGFCKNVDGFIIVFDLTKRESFSDVSNWLDGIGQHKDLSTCPFILIGTRLDLCNSDNPNGGDQRQVPRGLAETFAFLNE